MTEASESRVHRIASVAAARFIAEPRAHFLVMAFAHRPRTLGEVAQGLGLPMLSAWRLARRAVALGLLEEKGESPRRGRPLKLYQAAAPAFLIPDELMPRLPGDILSEELRERLRAEITRHGSCHIIRVGEDGEPQMNLLPAEAGGLVPFEAWRILRLDTVSARALEAELNAVLDRYEARQQPGGRSYLAHAAMVARRG
jgi:hypothetical protein